MYYGWFSDVPLIVFVWFDWFCLCSFGFDVAFLFCWIVIGCLGSLLWCG